jgi:TIR domain
MHDVYVSYTRDDQQAAEVIAGRLSSEGFSVFLDHDAIVAGESWSDRTIEEIRSAKAVLALLSSESRKNRWVAEELQAALDTKKLVVPVLLDKDAKQNWLWPLLALRHSVELDLRSPDWRPQLDELVRWLSVAIGKQEQALEPDWARIKAGKDSFEIIRRASADASAGIAEVKEIIPELPPGPITEALKSRVDRIEAANNSIIALSATGFSAGAPTLGTPESKQNPPSADTPRLPTT